MHQDFTSSELARSKRRRRQRGQSLVEFALILPIFLILLMGIVDFGLGLKSWIAITNSARESARYAAVGCASATVDATDVQEKAVKAATGLSITTADVDVVNCTAGSATESVDVTVRYDYTLVTPIGSMLGLLDSGVIKLKSDASMRME